MRSAYLNIRILYCAPLLIVPTRCQAEFNIIQIGEDILFQGFSKIALHVFKFTEMLKNLRGVALKA